MQKHMKLMSVPWWQTIRNGNIITCVFIILPSSEDKRFLYSNKSFNINMLQEEPEMQELRLQVDGKHEGDWKRDMLIHGTEQN